jgi:hypothetical protein
MTIHLSNLLILKDLKPEDKLSVEQEEIIRDSVIDNIHRVIAYTILGYADWLYYVCIRYLENGGIDDLEHIRQKIIFPLEVDYKIQEKVVNDIYIIIRPILINYEKYKRININQSFDIGASNDRIM